LEEGKGYNTKLFCFPLYFALSGSSSLYHREYYFVFSVSVFCNYVHFSTQFGSVVQ